MTTPTSRADFEVIYVVAELDERLEDAICETLDATVAYHSGLCLVTLTTAGHDGVHAGENGAATLSAMGVHVVRSYPDLVTRSDIAERVGVSSQAVGMWIRGERQDATSFPLPVHLVGTGAWLWADVNTWMAAAGKAVDDLRYPSLEDHAAVDVHLAVGGANSAVWQAISVGEIRVTFHPPVSDVQWDSKRAFIQGAGSSQREFGLTG